ncbi:MAG: hypothetical protein NTU83_08855, partial [Candidatus Hydrogenedentes bacterium]|nr:hypothetical protein [Candidatus Hydrogenedentota bacterium]
MKPMTSYERFRRMYAHEEADRVPVIDGPWSATIERWQLEGMPQHVSFVDYFDLDRTEWIWADNSPRYESKLVEETDAYRIETTSWGVTLRNWKHAASTPEFLDFTIVDWDSWRAAKQRMTPARDRIDWEHLRKHYRTWREKGYWIEAGLWFGFDITHSWVCGTQRVLDALLVDPEWCVDMFNHFLDVSIALLDLAWEEGYTFDAVSWCDDMGFKRNQFFSLDTYRKLIKP